MKAKPILFLVITLLIGFSLGMLTSAHIRHKRMRSVRMFSSERHFKEMIYRIIEPGEEQKKELDLIMKSFGKEGKEIQRMFRKEFEEHNSLYWNKIESLLTQDQLDLLEAYKKKRSEQMKSFKPDSTRRGRRNGRRGGPSPDWPKDSLSGEHPSR